MIVEGLNIDVNTIPSENRFGAIRKFDIHTGLDIFCKVGSEVYAYEDGEVVGIVPFTGEIANSPWWNDTRAVLVEGKSGVILYGEIEPVEGLTVVRKGDLIGRVLQVLRVDKGKPTSMLHVELYEHGYRGDGAVWGLGEEIPEKLLNVEALFK